MLDLGGKRVRHLDTPHVPHAWDAGLLYEETTNTLLCGDLFARSVTVRSSRPTTRRPGDGGRGRVPCLVDHAVDGADDPPARRARAVGARR